MGNSVSQAGALSDGLAVTVRRQVARRPSVKLFRLLDTKDSSTAHAQDGHAAVQAIDPPQSSEPIDNHHFSSSSSLSSVSSDVSKTSTVVRAVDDEPTVIDDRADHSHDLSPADTGTLYTPVPARHGETTPKPPMSPFALPTPPVLDEESPSKYGLLSADDAHGREQAAVHSTPSLLQPTRPTVAEAGHPPSPNGLLSGLTDDQINETLQSLLIPVQIEDDGAQQHKNKVYQPRIPSGAHPHELFFRTMKKNHQHDCHPRQCSPRTSRRLRKPYPASLFRDPPLLHVALAIPIMTAQLGCDHIKSTWKPELNNPWPVECSVCLDAGDDQLNSLTGFWICSHCALRVCSACKDACATEGAHEMMKRYNDGAHTPEMRR